MDIYILVLISAYMQATILFLSYSLLSVSHSFITCWIWSSSLKYYTYIVSLISSSHLSSFRSSSVDRLDSFFINNSPSWPKLFYLHTSRSRSPSSIQIQTLWSFSVCGSSMVGVLSPLITFSVLRYLSGPEAETYWLLFSCPSLVSWNPKSSGSYLPLGLLKITWPITYSLTGLQGGWGRDSYCRLFHIILAVGLVPTLFLLQPLLQFLSLVDPKFHWVCPLSKKCIDTFFNLQLLTHVVQGVSRLACLIELGPSWLLFWPTWLFWLIPLFPAAPKFSMPPVSD